MELWGIMVPALGHGGPRLGGPATPINISTYNHAEVDRTWGIQGIYHGSFKDHILITPGWPYTYQRMSAI